MLRAYHRGPASHPIHAATDSDEAIHSVLEYAMHDGTPLVGIVLKAGKVEG